MPKNLITSGLIFVGAVGVSIGTCILYGWILALVPLLLGAGMVWERNRRSDEGSR